MRTFLALFASATIGVFAFSQEPDDLKAIQGKWYLVQLDANGLIMFPSKQDKKKGTKPSVVIIKDDKMYFDDELEGTIRLDAKKLPKPFDITSEKSGAAGIYKLERDTLIVCWSSAAKGDTPERPKEFKTDRERPRDRMLTLKRTPK